MHKVGDWVMDMAVSPHSEYPRIGQVTCLTEHEVRIKWHSHTFIITYPIEWGKDFRILTSDELTLLLLTADTMG